VPFKRAKMVSQVWDSRGVQSELFFDSLGIDDEVFSLYRKIGGIKSVRCRLTRVKATDCHEQVSFGYEREFLDTGEKTIILDDNLSDGVPHNFESYCVCSASESVVSVPPTQCIARPASTDPSEDAVHPFSWRICGLFLLEDYCSPAAAPAPVLFTALRVIQPPDTILSFRFLPRIFRVLALFFFCAAPRRY